MGELYFFKLRTDMFDDEKIRIIESMPDADTILVIWVKLIAKAMKQNAGGWVYLSQEVPYSDEELAVVLSRPVNTVRLALQTFERMRMIELNDNGIFLVNFPKHQNVDLLDKVREQGRLRNIRYREKLKQAGQKSLPEGRDVSVTHRDATEAEAEAEIDKEAEIDYVNKSSVTELWQKTLERLKSQVNGSNFRIWLAETKAVGIDGQEFYVEVPRQDVKEHLDNFKRALVDKVLAEVCPGLRVVFVVKEANVE